MLSGAPIHFNPAPGAINALIEPAGNPSISITTPAQHHTTPAPPSGPAPNPNPNPNRNLPPPSSPPDLVPLSLLLDPRFTIDQLADQFHTTMEAISIWMLQPDIQERIEVIETVSIQRAQIAAHRALPAVATACHSIVTTFNTIARTEQLDPDDHAGVEQERRNAETARRAGALLLRLARFRRAPATAAPASQPASPRASAPASDAPHPKSDTPQDLAVLINSPDFQAALATALNAPNQSRAAQAAGNGGQSAEDNHAADRRSPANPPPSAQLKDLLVDLLQSRSDLEPPLDRLATQLSTADAAIATHPP